MRRSTIIQISVLVTVLVAIVIIGIPALRPYEVVQGQDAAQYHRVLRVVDGDTIDVEQDGQSRRVRLIGVNTPETVDKRRPIQCFGPEASHFVKHLLDHRVVRLEGDPGKENTDKYHRLLRFVYLSDGTLLNEQLIRDGYGQEYTFQHQAYLHQAEFKQVEAEAKSANRGLWSPATCGGKLKPA